MPIVVVKEFESKILCSLDILLFTTFEKVPEFYQLKTINKMRGHPESHIDVEGDGCYNNPLYSGIGKTPFQPATQSCYVVVENMTDKKLVINLVTKNKLCSHGKDHSNENINNKKL